LKQEEHVVACIYIFGVCISTTNLVANNLYWFKQSANVTGCYIVISKIEGFRETIS